MSDTDSYEDILNRSWSEIPEDKLLPVGTWRHRLQNVTLLRPKQADQSPVVLFTYAPMEPLDDVDEDEVAELGEGYDYTTKRLFARFWVETGADWDKVRKHLAMLGVECTEDQSIQDTFKSAKSAEINSYVGLESYKNAMDEVETRNNMSGFTAVDD